MSLWAAALPWTIISAHSILRAKVTLSFGRETEKKGTMGENLYKMVSEKNNMLIFAVLISLSYNTGSTGKLASIKSKQYQRNVDPLRKHFGLLLFGSPSLFWTSYFLLIHLDLLTKLICIACKSIQTQFISSNLANCQLPTLLLISVTLPRDREALDYTHWMPPEIQLHISMYIGLCLSCAASSQNDFLHHRVCMYV